MSNTLGKAIKLTVFGESHGPCIGGVLDGIPAGLKIDAEYIKGELEKRKSLSSISTPRSEDDEPVFISGIKDGFTEGTPLALTIANKDVKSGDYEEISRLARPGHADYSAEMKYLGYQDPRGGGHFSGRLTAVLVTAGAIMKNALEDKGIVIASHIEELAGVRDADFDFGKAEQEACALNEKAFACLSDEAAEAMIAKVEEARADGDSVGGIIETVVLGLEPGIGEPMFASVESDLSAALFSIGGVKGIEFGKGFEIARMRGSEANDAFRMEGGKVVTSTNNNGGINGGISNGMPIVFRTAVKPTPSISKEQETVDFKSMEDATLSIKGRHDPAIVHRAVVVVNAVTALTVADLICRRYGYMWFAGGNGEANE